MIADFAELLREFIGKEVNFLDSQSIKHGPTIGKMYEGLTHKLLTKSIPQEWGLRVTEGFITNKKGKLSDQIDCMLVVGAGEKIPYTDSYKFDIDNVLAVLEIKKNLYSAELSDAYENLRSVYSVLQGKKINHSLLHDAYASILQELLPTQDELKKFPVWKDQIYRSLVFEEMLPIRIALGYHGFSKESNFRKAFITYLDKHLGEDGFGPNSLPNLIISDTFSIVKLNGMPYSTPIRNDEKNWHVLASYSGNPLILLLELLLTKITYHFGFTIRGFSDDLGIENLKPLLLAKAIEHNGSVGWQYGCLEFTENELSLVPLFDSWQPVEIDNLQAAIIYRLISEEEISTSENWFMSLVEDPDYSDMTLSQLVNSGLISSVNGIVRLLTNECSVVFMPNGSIVAGHKNSGRLMNWLNGQMEEEHKGNKNS